MVLRLLGDARVTFALLEGLQSVETPGERIAVAHVLGRLADERAVPSIVAIYEDAEEPRAVRAACARALGEIARAHLTDWSAPFANDLLYSCVTWTLESPFGDASGLLDRR